MLGDGHCNEECFTPECEYDIADCLSRLCSVGCWPKMLGDGRCDSACHVPACQWDLTDCDCSPGCTDALLQNGECDAVCGAQQCAFDGHRCVRTNQGDCASGCFSAMLGNGHCDSECNSEECEWDRLDCGCAPGCSFDEIETCKVECLVPDCNYGQMAEYPVCSSLILRTAAKYYHIQQSAAYSKFYLPPYSFENFCLYCPYELWIASFSVCLEDDICNSNTCLYNFGNCAASERCEALATTTSSMCYRCRSPYLNNLGQCVDTCDFGLSPHPLVTDLCYPVKDPTTASAPEVLFINPEYEGTDADGSFARPLRTLAQGLSKTKKRFTKLMLVGPLHTLTNDPTSFILHGADNPIPRTPSDNQESVVIASYECELEQPCVRPTIWVEDATLPSIMGPGPTFAVEVCNSAIVRGTLEIMNVAFRMILQASACLLDENLLVLNSNDLVLTNVTFTGIHSYNYIVESGNRSNITLDNVDFFQISVCNCLIKQIMESSDICELSKLMYQNTVFSYTRGTVSVQSIQFDIAFISFNEIGLLQIEEVNFVNNGVKTLLFSFVQVLEIRQLLLRNCVFKNNTLLQGNFLSLSTPNTNLTFCLLTPMPNVIIAGCRFQGNSLPATSHISLSSDIVYHSLLITNCSFQDDTAATFIYVSSFTPVNKVRIAGFHQYSQGVRTDFAPSFAVIEHLSFRNVSGKSLIYMKNMLNIRVTNVSREGTRESDCTPMFVVEASYNVSIEGLRVSDIDCQQGVAGVIGAGLFGGFRLSTSEFVTVTGGILVALSSYDSIVLSDLLVANCSCGQGKGLVSASGQVTVANSTFEGNSVSTGGVLRFVNVSALSITHCRFANNSATTLHGGVISLTTSEFAPTSFLINASIFFGNRASVRGGVVYVDLVPPSSFLGIVVVNSSFRANQAEEGAVLYIAPRISLTAGSVFEDCSFTENVATTAGVLALYFKSGSLAIRKSSFIRNQASRESCLLIAFSAVSANLYAEQLVFEENTGSSIVGLTSASVPSMFFGRALTFRGNSGVSLDLTNSAAVLDNCSFVNNSAAEGPALSLSAGSAVRLANTQFVSNSARNYGGAVMVTEASTFQCDNCSFIRNTANAHGGALRVDQDSLLILRDSRLEGNTAQKDGSVLYILMTSLDSYAENCVFLGNHAKGDGAIVMYSSRFALRKSVMSANTNDKTSPGVVINLSNFTAEECQFEQQTGVSGEFLYVSTLSFVNISQCSFDNGTSTGMGGIYIDESDLYISDSIFRYMTAVTGSALYCFGNTAVVLLNTSFVNHANSEGGILDLLFSTVSVERCTFASFQSTAIFGEDAKITVKNSSFSSKYYVDGRAAQGAGIRCSQCTFLQAVDCVFENLFAESGSALYLDAQEYTVAAFIVNSSQFLNNNAGESGAIHADDIALVLDNNLFLNNSATGLQSRGRGGAVALLCTSNAPICSFFVISNRFWGNSATVKGGAVCWERVRPLFNSNTFKQNSAPYGPDVSSFAVSLASDNSSLKAVASGQRVNALIDVWLVDHYGQLISIDNSTKARITATKNYSAIVYGTTQLTAVMGRFRFRDFIVSAPPKTNVTVQISVEGYSSIVLSVSMRECVVGENEVDGRCLVCDSGTFSLDPEQPCQDCPSQAVCYGNFTMAPRAGYWRSDNLSTRFFQCPNAQACIGPPALTGTCAEGYGGIKCSVCATDYYRVSKVFCEKCGSKSSSLMQAIGLFVGIVVFSIVIVKSSIRSAYRPKAMYSIYLKIFMNYLQVVMLMNAFNLSWPKLTQKLLDVQNTAGGFIEQLLNTCCLVDDYRETNEYYSRLLVMAFVPLLFVTLSSVVWGFVALTTHSWNVLKNELVASALILFFLVHPSVLRVMLSAFDCEEIDPGEYWLSGLELRCWTGEHPKYAFGVALPSIIMWGVAVPTLVLLLLCIQHKRFDQLNLKIRFGYLVTGYSREKFFWEFVVIYRKMLLIAIAVLLSQVSEFIKALLALAVLLFSLILQEKHKPYTRHCFNVMEHRSLLVSTITIFCGLYFLDQSLGTGLESVFIACIFAVNVFFLQSWLKRFLNVFVVMLVRRVQWLQRYFVVINEETIKLTRRRQPIVQTTPGVLERTAPNLMIWKLYKIKLDRQARNNLIRKSLIVPLDDGYLDLRPDGAP